MIASYAELYSQSANEPVESPAISKVGRTDFPKVGQEFWAFFPRRKVCPIGQNFLG